MKWLFAMPLVFMVGYDADPYRGFMTKTGGPCCGGTDCKIVDAKAVPGGYIAHGTQMFFIPNDQAQLGFDQHYHLCEFPTGTPRCFLLPTPGV